jgi:hypothetical protein
MIESESGDASSTRTASPESPSDSTDGPSVASKATSRVRSLGPSTRGQGGTNLVSLFIGILIAAVIGISVVIPVINDTIANANLSGTTATVVGLIPLFVALMLLVGLASPLMRRV